MTCKERPPLRFDRRQAGTLLAALLTLIAVFVLAPRCLAAGEPYEPNNSTLEASGPLTIGQTYGASLETSTDKDYFYFYVSSPVGARDGANVTLTVKNLGGGGPPIDVAILDPRASPVDAVAYFLAGGEAASATTSLEPQRYLVEVSAASATPGATLYSLTAGGTPGAFVPYSQIASRCESGTAAVAVARTRLRRAQAKLQRANARLRQSLYGSSSRRRAAQAKYRKARARVDGMRKALNSARDSQTPWCLIPE